MQRAVSSGSGSSGSSSNGSSGFFVGGFGSSSSVLPGSASSATVLPAAAATAFSLGNVTRTLTLTYPLSLVINELPYLIET